MTDDSRINKEQPLYFVTCKDSFMSGWGNAPGRSLMAFACFTEKQVEAVEIALRGRSEMKRVNVNKGLPNLSKKDHLKIHCPESSPEFYKGMAARWMKGK